MSDSVHDTLTQLRLMTLARDKCLERIRQLESYRDQARSWNESHISRLEKEVERLKAELAAAAVWKIAFEKGRARRRVVM